MKVDNVKNSLFEDNLGTKICSLLTKTRTKTVEAESLYFQNLNSKPRTQASPYFEPNTRPKTWPGDCSDCCRSTSCLAEFGVETVLPSR